MIMLLAVLSFLLLELELPRFADGLRIATPLALILLGSICALHLPRLLQPCRGVVTALPLWAFAIYALWATLSLFWSPTAADGAGHVALLWVTLLAAVALSENPPRQLAHAALTIFTLTLLLSWLTAALGLEDSVNTIKELWRLKGLMAHEQRLALLAGATLLLLLTECFNRHRSGQNNWFLLPIALLAVLSLLATQARAFASITLCLALLLLLIELRPSGRGLLLAVSGFIALAIASGYESMLPYLSRGEQDASLTGRLSLWNYVWEKIAAQPWLGHGFASFLSSGSFSQTYQDFIPAHAHNMWLQSLYETGIIGTTLLAFFMLALLLHGLRYRSLTGIMPFSLPLTLLALCCGMTGLVIGGKMATLYGVILLFIAQELFILGANWTKLPPTETTA